MKTRELATCALMLSAAVWHAGSACGGDGAVRLAEHCCPVDAPSNAQVGYPLSDPFVPLIRTRSRVAERPIDDPARLGVRTPNVWPYDRSWVDGGRGAVGSMRDPAAWPGHTGQPSPVSDECSATGFSDPFIQPVSADATGLDEQQDAQPAPVGSGRSQRALERELELLQERLDEFEAQILAKEEATRTIVRRSFAERGSNITEAVVFGGTLESLAGWTEDFDGVAESDIVLDTAELDFEIQVNDWTLGSLIFEYIDGTDFLFPTTEGDEALVDRVNIDTAFVTLGNTQRFWLFGTFGRVIVPFGISTGDPVADVLNIESPLTVEVFETKQDVILIGFEAPTPPPPPPLSPDVPAPPAPPKVRPVLMAPFFYKLSRCLGYCPWPQPPVTPPTPLPPPPAPPPYNGAIYFYNGATNDGGEDHIEHFGATLGYRTNGWFRYQMPIISPCPCTPWSLDVDVDFNSSVFDSLFLAFEYRHFLDQIGFVPGMAAHLKSNLGPVSLVAEWNGAVSDATLFDDFGRHHSLAPSAWQVSLAYQFDWNPSVEIIGEQGTYVTISYSESQDLAGITRVFDGQPTRMGFVPEKRFLVSVGEWVLDGVRVAFEYSHIVDYAVAEGGTGNSADGFFAQLTYVW